MHKVTSSSVREDGMKRDTGMDQLRREETYTRSSLLQEDDEWDVEPEIELEDPADDSDDVHDAGEDCVETGKSQSSMTKRIDSNDYDMDKLLEGRVTRKITKPMLPGPRKSKPDKPCQREVLTITDEEIWEPSQDGITKTAVELNRKKTENGQKGPLKVTDKEDGREVTATTDEDECPKQRKAKVVYYRKVEQNRKRQKLAIEEGGEECFASTLLCPANKRMARTEINLGDFIGDGHITPKDITLCISEDGELSIDFDIQ